MTFDYAKLYSQLDVQPDCSLVEFKRACRRRIAQMHPDRSGPADDFGDGLPLTELVKLYRSAVRFHRRHGRLPGAHVAPNVRIAPRAAAAPTAETSVEEILPPAKSGPDYRSWLIILAAAAVLIALGSWHNPPLPTTQVAALSVRLPATQVTALPVYIELGMDKATVRAIQGEPLQIHEDEWDYGPSWMKFDKGKLADWYSSPLYRLKTQTPAPPPRTADP